MSLIAGICCRFILNIMHILFSLYLQLKLFKFVFYKTLSKIYALFCNKLRRQRTENELIERNVRHFSKIPKHLSFAVGEEIISYSDLAQIILWTLPTGIPVLSFYDPKNELNADILYQTFSACYPESASCIKWGVSYSTQHIPEENTSTKISAHCLQVNVLNSMHSRQLLIDSIKELCSRTDLKLYDRAATEAALDSIMLSKLCYSGNPDFLVISGNVYTTFGLSPWHIGFTEFLTVPSYRFLTVNEYVKILKNYADCDQKFGR